ncbi:copper chaperone PCu(A)C [Ruegeria sp.]|uniref:copper chaperone PCu(A)C n=1 Tax=Ruegeria sp. TaxID=1879320 RepID=UPI0023258B10|nr:copper chaperone PCu(A)C [Ruegeria sp.]MDA7966659.1 copper chaperone PCu(A)C [Ruegeria sp.]
MSFKSTLLATLAAASLVTAAFAGGEIKVDDAYARSSGANAKAGAAFMMIVNQGEAEDRLIGVTSDVAARVELHTHKIDENGVAKMVHVEEGFVIPAGESHMLKRGGDHVMFMGLKQPFEQDATVPVTLIFEQAGEVQVEIPVDLERKDAGAHSH